MAFLVYVVIYSAVLLFLAGCLRRIIQYARTPLHLRWELYPVPHERPDRVAHGGSYFEESDAWRKPESSRSNLRGELRFMLAEILFFKGLWEFNRPLWRVSFPFHFGLYLVITATLLLFLSVALALAAPAVSAGAAMLALKAIYRLVGVVGCVLVLAGAAGLLRRRVQDEELRTYTSAADIFNLLFFIATFVWLAVGYILRGPGAPSADAIARGLLTFDTTLKLPDALSTGLVLGAILMAYIPFTHMAHFIGKYFTYHAVRWDDSRNRRGSGVEVRVAQQLTYKPTWGATHVGSNGKKTWAEIAATNPAQKGLQ
ncbi:MAG: respiratory nitrate reductase subunit gamma [Terriglobales bacterium]